QKHGGVPVLALTATASHEVTDDIVAQLGMRSPAHVRGTFFRPNLRLSAYRKGGDQRGDGTGQGPDAAAGARTAGPKGTRSAIFRLVDARRGQSGIIYAISRKACESLADALRARGVRAAAYHARMGPAGGQRVPGGLAQS